jgi:hypothetical protein
VVLRFAAWKCTITAGVGIRLDREILGVDVIGGLIFLLCACAKIILGIPRFLSFVSEVECYHSRPADEIEEKSSSDSN